jgi:CheY-like chemotaxis protein
MIVLADPDPESRRELARVLLHAGYDVRAVATGMEVVQVLFETNPRLIILDLDLKWVSGRHLIDFFQRNERLARIPVLALSSSGEAPSGVPTLRRPADPVELLRWLAEVETGVRHEHRDPGHP